MDAITIPEFVTYDDFQALVDAAVGWIASALVVCVALGVMLAALAYILGMLWAIFRGANFSSQKFAGGVDTRGMSSGQIMRQMEDLLDEAEHLSGGELAKNRAEYRRLEKIYDSL